MRFTSSNEREKIQRVGDASVIDNNAILHGRKIFVSGTIRDSRDSSLFFVQLARIEDSGAENNVVRKIVNADLSFGRKKTTSFYFLPRFHP